jgi:hypothetical protein
VNPVASILDIVASLFGFARKRQDLVNTPEMKANASAKTDQQIKDESAKIISDQDANAAARGISE